MDFAALNPSCLLLAAIQRVGRNSEAYSAILTTTRRNTLRYCAYALSQKLHPCLC
jgi:hypothetical protein